MKTVILFGAGASAASEFRLPTMKNFFEGFEASSYPELKAFIQKYFSGIPVEELDLEAVLTELHLTNEGFGTLWLNRDSSTQRAYEQCLSYIHKKLWHGGDDRTASHASALFQRLFMHSSPNDSFLTLNYDLVVDYSLWKFENQQRAFEGNRYLSDLETIVSPPSTAGQQPITMRKEDHGFYIKLHGSLDWLTCPRDECPNHHRIYCNQFLDTRLRAEIGDPCIVCGAGLVPVIVPPVFEKSFQRFPKLGILWKIAYRELQAADSVVLIGTSLRESDSFLLWALRHALRETTRSVELVIVNLLKKHRDRAQGLLGMRVSNALTDLESYVRGLEDATPSRGSGRS